MFTVAWSYIFKGRIVKFRFVLVSRGYQENRLFARGWRASVNLSLLLVVLFIHWMDLGFWMNTANLCSLNVLATTNISRYTQLCRTVLAGQWSCLWTNLSTNGSTRSDSEPGNHTTIKLPHSRLLRQIGVKRNRLHLLLLPWPVLCIELVRRCSG